MVLSSSGPGPGLRSGPGQFPGQVQKVQGLSTKDLDHSRVPAVFIDPGKQGRGPGQVENRDNILPGLGEMSQCDVE